MPSAPTSVPRLLVDQALADEDTTFEEWARRLLLEDTTIEAMWLRLKELTDHEFSIRTLFRWLEELDEVAS